MLETKTETASFKENWKFIEDNRDHLTEKYPDHWIAVHDKKVVAADPDPREFVAKMRKIGPFPDPGKGVVELLISEETDWIHLW